MEYLYVNKNWDIDKEPEKIYYLDKGINDPDPINIFDEELNKNVEIKRYWTYTAPGGYVK